MARSPATARRGRTGSPAHGAASSIAAAGDRRPAGRSASPAAAPGALHAGRLRDRSQSRPRAIRRPIEVWYSELRRGAGASAASTGRRTAPCSSAASARVWPATSPARRRAHFADLLEAAEARAFPHLLRVWNFLPGINASENGTERYRLFNAGRAAAFDARYGVAGAEARFSASSAVGSSGDHLVTWFAAARSPGLHLGNPRQVHAFRYPTDYGPRPPSFTRATLSPPELGQVLFLSGTASIAGHETRHVGKLLLQLEETLRNIEIAARGRAGRGGEVPRSRRRSTSSGSTCARPPTSSSCANRCAGGSGPGPRCTSSRPTSAAPTSCSRSRASPACRAGVG